MKFTVKNCGFCGGSGKMSNGYKCFMCSGKGKLEMPEGYA